MQGCTKYISHNSEKLSKTKAVILFLLAIILFGTVAFFTFRNVDLVELFSSVTASDALINLLLGTAYFITFGWVMAIVFRAHYKIDYPTFDLAFLPFQMHLFTYLMPVKGGMLYQTFFMKMKHKMDLSKGFSSGIFVFIASLLLTCMAGLALSFQLEGVQELRLLLGLMSVGLLVLTFGSRFIPERKDLTGSWVSRLLGFVQRIGAGIGDLFSDPLLFVKVFLMTAISAGLQSWWFYHTAIVLGYDVSWMGMTFATLIIRILMLVRFVPGNLGFQEIMSGAVFVAAGLTIEDGLLVAMINRLASVALAGTLGFGALYYNFRYFGTQNLKQLFAEMKSSN